MDVATTWLQCFEIMEPGFRWASPETRRPVRERPLGALQYVRAWALGRAFGHPWALLAPTLPDNAVPSPALLEHWTRDVTGLDATACEVGLLSPRVTEEGIVHHVTLTGALGWSIHPSGETDLWVFDPGTGRVVLRATVYPYDVGDVALEGEQGTEFERWEDEVLDRAVDLWVRPFASTVCRASHVAALRWPLERLVEVARIEEELGELDVVPDQDTVN